MRRWLVWLAIGGGGVLLSGALVIDALGGLLFYTTQSELCEKVLRKIQAGASVDVQHAMSVCSNRDEIVGRAFFVEVVSGVAVFASTIFLLRRVRSRAK